MGKNQKSGQKQNRMTEWWDILPLILMVTVEPLIAVKQKVSTYLGQFPWFPADGYQDDYFMYGKMIVLLILAVWSLVMMLDKSIIRRKKRSLEKRWIVLGLYGLLVMISTVCSIDKNLSIKGMWQQYETVWTLLGYLITVFAAFWLAETEKQRKILLLAACTGAAVEVIPGLLQMAGRDIWGNKSRKVYMTLYNPNYAAVYIILVLPLVLATVMLVEKKWQKAVLTLVAILLGVCLIGSRSRTGIAVLVILAVVLAICLCPGKKKLLAILLGVAIPVIALTAVGESGRRHLRRGLERTMTRIEEYKFQDIHADGERVYFRYLGKEIWLDMTVQDGELILTAADEQERSLPVEWNNTEQCWQITEEPFTECKFTLTYQDGIGILCMSKSGADWNFAKKGMNGSYGYVTRFGKIDTIEEAPAVLKGYERALSGRGYIWGRTIPLLSKHILLGTGPDTFIEAFPQNDYVKRYNSSNHMYNEIPSKAHSMYLQSALQTGVLSMICLLVFWIWYLKDSVSLYLIQKKRDWLGLACAVSVTGYLLMGLMNDSNLATAPVFWCILGLGLSINTGHKKAVENSTQK